MTKYEIKDCVAIIPEETTMIEVGPNTLRGYYESLGDVSIGIPDSLIGLYKFLGCISSTSLFVPIGVKEMGDSLPTSFKTSLRSVFIPDSVTVIGYRTFSGCISLRNVVIPDSVMEIGYCAFEGCTSLENVVIGKGVRKIRPLAFRNCASLKTITLSVEANKIEVNVFDGCDNIEMICVPVKRTEYYKKLLPERLHDKIVETE